MTIENTDRREILSREAPNRILAVRYKTESAIASNLKPVFVGPHSRDDLNSFINESIKASLRRMEELGNPNQYRQKTYGPRGNRELGDIMKNNAILIQQREHEIMVLRGDRLGVVEVTKDKNGKPIKLEVTPIPDEQRKLWEPIYSASRAASDNPQALELIVEVFNLRFQIKHGDFETSEKAKNEFHSLRKQLGDFLDNNKSLEAPVSYAVKSITKAFS